MSAAVCLAECINNVGSGIAAPCCRDLPHIFLSGKLLELSDTEEVKYRIRVCRTKCDIVTFT